MVISSAQSLGERKPAPGGTKVLALTSGLNAAVSHTPCMPRRKASHIGWWGVGGARVSFTLHTACILSQLTAHLEPMA